MPLYFFQLQGSAPDTEGQEFADDETAREEARAVARDLAQNRSVAPGERLVVLNSDGEVVHEEPLDGS